MNQVYTHQTFVNLFLTF